LQQSVSAFLAKAGPRKNLKKVEKKFCDLTSFPIFAIPTKKGHYLKQ